MRKFLFLALTALLLAQGAGARADSAPVRRMVPYERYALQGGGSELASGNPLVASVDEMGVVTALSPGEAEITRAEKGGKAVVLRVVVEEEPQVPAAVQEAIAVAVAEWEAAGGEPMKQSNKYTAWYYGPKASFRWCGAFAAYALDAGGVPLSPTDTYRDLVPLADGSPWGAREAGVPKLLKGFENLDRRTNLPRPGYLVVYGERGGYAAKHVGLVTRVTSLGDGRFLVETAEGNLNSRIKRLSYVYDSRAGEEDLNIRMVDEAMQARPEVFQYRLTDEDWLVTAFLQTWY